MEYASVIWDPMYNTDSDKLECIQRKAARWALSSYAPRASVDAMLEELQWQPLKERRRIQRLAFMYKILNNKVAVPAESVDIVLNTRPVRYTDTNQQKVVTKRAKNEQFKRSFIIKTIPEWNALSQAVVSADSEASFKSRLTGQTP